jgi:hypothetical protein
VARADIADDAVNTAKIADGSNSPATSPMTPSEHQDQGWPGARRRPRRRRGDVDQDPGRTGRSADQPRRGRKRGPADGAVTGGKVSVPLTFGRFGDQGDGAHQRLQRRAGGATHAVNSSTGSGIAGFFESAGSDTTLVVMGNGSGELFKGFGSDGGNSEIRIENNGTLKPMTPPTPTLSLWTPAPAAAPSANCGSRGT